MIGWPMSGFSDMGTSTLHLRFEVYAYAQPDDKRLVTAGRVGKLALADSVIRLDQGHRQRTGADIDAAIHSGRKDGNGLVHRPSPELRWSRLPPRPQQTAF